jgi:hypothetical protein
MPASGPASGVQVPLESAVADVTQAASSTLSPFCGVGVPNAAEPSDISASRLSGVPGRVAATGSELAAASATGSGASAAGCGVVATSASGIPTHWHHQARPPMVPGRSRASSTSSSQGECTSQYCSKD